MFYIPEERKFMKPKQTDCIAHNMNLVEQVKSEMLEDSVLFNIANFYKIMGDYTRIRLLRALEISEMCVCDLSVLLNMTKSALSHQLKALKNARLVKSQKKGKHVFYSLNDEHIKIILDIALKHLSEKTQK